MADLFTLSISERIWRVSKGDGGVREVVARLLGVVVEMPITTAEEKAQRRLEVKARSTLMMGILNEHQLKFNSIKDAKKLLEAVEKRFDEKLSQEDVNQIFFRSLSLEWNTHAVVWRNKADLNTMSMDDLHNNLKVYEPEVKGMSKVQAHRTGLFNVKTECYNCHKRGHFARECRAPRNQDNKNRKLKKECACGSNLLSTILCHVMVLVDMNGGVIRQRKGLIMHSWLSYLQVQLRVRKYDDASSIEEHMSDDEEGDVSQPKTEKKTVRPSIVKKEFVKSKQQEKTTRKTVKQVEQHRQSTHNPRGNQRNWDQVNDSKYRKHF
ncbi:ribonuclease H-like domain-containing protein [Tanacetum coccineum]